MNAGTAMKYFHIYVLTFFTFTIFFGFMFILSALYEEHRSIVVVNLDADRILYTAYRFRKDKANGTYVENVYMNDVKTNLFDKALNDMSEDHILPYEEVTHEMNLLLMSSDIRARDAILFVNFPAMKYVTEKFQSSLEKMIEPMMDEFRRSFGKVYQTSFPLLTETIAAYLTLNAMEEVKNDSLYFNSLIDFSPSGFSWIYHVGSLDKFPDKNQVITYQLGENSLNFFLIMNKCFGQFVMFLKMVAPVIYPNKANIFRTPCLPPNFNATSKNIPNVYFNNTCVQYFLKNLTFVGTGDAEKCNNDLNAYLRNNICPEDGSRSNTCYHQPQTIPANLPLFISNDLYVLLEELKAWKGIRVDSSNFSAEYFQAKDFLCKNDLFTPENQKKVIGLNKNELVTYCWKLIYYQTILSGFGYRLDNWRNFRYVRLKQGITKGIAIFEANAQMPTIVWNIFANKYNFYMMILLATTPLYFVGISILYFQLQHLFQVRRVFAFYYHEMARFKQIDLSESISKRMAKIKRKGKGKGRKRIAKIIYVDI